MDPRLLLLERALQLSERSFGLALWADKITPQRRDVTRMFGYPASTLLAFVNEARIYAAAVAAVAAVVTGLASYAQIRLQTTVSAEKDRAFREYQLSAEENIAAAKQAAAAASLKAAELELESERLRQKVAWRTLSKDQAELLVSAIGNSEFEIRVSTVGTDPEASMFFEQITATLQKTKLKVSGFTGYEVAVDTVITDKPEAASKVVQSALEAAGVSFFVVPAEAVRKDGRLELRIGTKSHHL